MAANLFFLFQKLKFMKNNNKAVNLIVGGNSQDAQFLTKLLIKKEEKVVLLVNKKISKSKYDSKLVSSVKIDIYNQNKVFKFLKKFKLLKIFYLASSNLSVKEKENSKLLNKNLLTNVIGLVNFLEFARSKPKKIKLFYACSSHIYNDTLTESQNEKTSPKFKSNYSLVKYLGKEICSFYRKIGVFCSVGILYSHVSKLSKKKFLIKDILSQIKNNKKKIKVLNCNSKIDLLSASDAINAIYKIMNLNNSDEFIISSNKLVRVKDIFNKIVQIKNKKFLKLQNIKSKKKLINSTTLKGENYKLRKLTGWKQNDNLEAIIKEFI